MTFKKFTEAIVRILDEKADADERLLEHLKELEELRRLKRYFNGEEE